MKYAVSVFGPDDDSGTQKWCVIYEHPQQYVLSDYGDKETKEDDEVNNEVDEEVDEEDDEVVEDEAA